MLLDGVVQPLRTIVALAELSPKSDNAVARAALLASEHGATLRLRIASMQSAAYARAMRFRSSSTRRAARISSSSPPSAATRCATSC